MGNKNFYSYSSSAFASKKWISSHQWFQGFCPCFRNICFCGYFWEYISSLLMKINHVFCSVLFAKTKWELIRTGLVYCELKYARFHICWSGAVYNWQWYWCLFNLLEFIVERYLLTSSYFWQTLLHTYMMQNKCCTITRSELSKSRMQFHRWFSKNFSGDNNNFLIGTFRSAFFWTKKIVPG